MNFKPYQHIERFGTEDVEDINIGLCYIFPKIDGTNANVWLGDDGKICAGGRKRELSLQFDNHGFYNTIINDHRIIDFFYHHRWLRLYGEWLCPHTLKTYRDDAWRKFYIFDVVKDDTLLHPTDPSRYLTYEQYKPLLDEYGLDYIPPIAIIRNPSQERLISLLDKNIFLLKDGHGAGEGIVIKNYEYRNKYGRVTWAKMVRTEFKDKHSKQMGCKETKEKVILESKIVEENLSGVLIDKVIANIKALRGGWRSEYIPQLLGTVYHDFVVEEIWEIVKKYKYPKIDFNMLNKFIILGVKALRPEIFGYEREENTSRDKEAA